MKTPVLTNMRKTLDKRGDFKKILDQDVLQNMGIEFFRAVEMFSSTTKKFGVRGMHIQGQPNKCRKLIWVTKGCILDVVVNVQSGEVFSFYMDDSLDKVLYVPENFAHGFQALSDKATVNYLTDAKYDPKSDTGFHVESFGFNWPEPIGVISERDQNLANFKEFNEFR